MRIPPKPAPGRRGGPYSQALRVLKMIRFLVGTPSVDLVVLADLYEISVRQVRRDLRILERAGFEIERSYHGHGHVRVRIPAPKKRGRR